MNPKCNNHKCPNNYKRKEEEDFTAQRRQCDSESRDWSDALWRWRKRPQAKEYRGPLEAEKR